MGLWPAHLLGVRRSALIGGAPPARTFETELREHEAERHGRIVACASGPSVRSRLPPGWRAEDLLGQADGFVSLAEAANAMGITEAEVVAMARAGALETMAGRVRPAIVNMSWLGTTPTTSFPMRLERRP